MKHPHTKSALSPRRPIRHVFFVVLLGCAAVLEIARLGTAADRPPVAVELATSVVNAVSLRGKAVCGYQGWFRCPGDAANPGWGPWSRHAHRIAPETLPFEMWPPTQGHFVGYEGLPSDWYLRLVGEGGRRLKQGLPVPAETPLQP
jgi:hypothetical protein